MNQIILAYAPENAALADAIDRSLSRIGIPFEHVHGAVAAQIASTGEPVLLLVTDNFLKSRDCMEGLLPVLQGLVAAKRLVAVIADGKNTEGQTVSTQIDRMANALHYMKHWQDAWLALSDRYQYSEGVEKAGPTTELDATRGIANEVGDLIGVLREAGYLTWQQFEANDFEAFFQQFSLQDWHGQYKRLAAQGAENQAVVELPMLPEMPVVGGLLAPEPLKDEHLDIPKPETVAPQNEEPTDKQPPENETPAPVAEHLTGEPLEPNDQETSEVKQSVRDAWLWIEKGYVERGIELFQSALEQYPESEWLKTEYEKAKRETSSHPLDVPQPLPPENSEPAPSDEIKSYDLMGDMAAERGDYLFAKYCWDRVSEIDQNFPNIYRKLGLMTAEHLRDYRETAAIYLRKALETNAHDAEVRAALGQLAVSSQQEAVDSSGQQETQSIADQPIHPAYRQAGDQPITDQPIHPAYRQAGDQPITNQPVHQTLVLITGATSGIGRATAEIFARNGYQLILTGRRRERLMELKNQFETEYGTTVLALPFDVSDAGAVEAALANLPESFQEIDILVNNAGLAKGLAPIHEGNLEHWETMIDTNVKGLLYVTRLVSPGMVRRRSGHIINVGSSAGKEAYPNGNVYCATKFSVDALTKSMRFDLHAHNIRVSQVSPGHVEETEFAINRFDGDAERAKIYNDFQPLKSSDVADAIYFMATRPPHVNIQDLQLFATQQASSMVIDRSGR